MFRIMVHASPTILSMLSSHFSYALKPVKTRAVPVVDMNFSHNQSWVHAAYIAGSKGRVIVFHYLF